MTQTCNPRQQGRFIASVLEAAKTAETDLPWARGARRAAMIARRKQNAGKRKTA
ncbi:hypothetical protein [Salipiger aestuarii]|uniref:Uncharacterized protein n=1 Tax=Salipiger aestuarii TaxID=568098 RepID=A0A327XX46_9RHOB|nr:hypothetical protein [Salipiger aestuarii]EIE49438.1 hypothetical protein C357_18931 [Citreicella sp. 357]RAK13233.1 hypothetical protein ATI53_103818 [Salipiger aestuarii]